VDSTKWGELVNHPKGGELWIHKTTGDHYIVKSTYTINPTRDRQDNRNEIVVVKTIRLRDQYEIEEPIGMFLWDWERIN
jgi:hypothetical protein